MREDCHKVESADLLSTIGENAECQPTQPPVPSASGTQVDVSQWSEEPDASTSMAMVEGHLRSEMLLKEHVKVCL